MEAPGTWSCQLTAAPGHQSDSALACSSAPHPSDPQPPNLTTKREKTDISTFLSADILALRPQQNRCGPSNVMELHTNWTEGDLVEISFRFENTKPFRGRIAYAES